MSQIDTDSLSELLRQRAIDVAERRLLISDFTGSKQSEDLTAPPNCSGLGRLRHFRRKPRTTWINPLPIDPALNALKMAASDTLIAQVFQNAVCNWRCWYCFVDFKLLSANINHARWVSADDLIQLYLNEEINAHMIDLSGGQPDLTPEWIVWMMDALTDVGLADKVYLWSDDNLSNDYFWRYLSPQQIDRIIAYPLYGRVACFKGIDEDSFAFNTMADPALFHRQFNIFERLLQTGIDLYAYVTFTVPSATNIRQRISDFVDKLQSVDEMLPLRTIPLYIDVFTPVKSRLDERRIASMEIQNETILHWREVLESRFDEVQRAMPITDIHLGRA